MTHTKESEEFYQQAYPPELADVERRLLGLRPDRAPGDEPRVGVALSGGGIRSATFALGVFQGLAKRRLLGQIDFLSTVSGGGYFGAFYGRLFNRAEVAGIDAVQAALDPDQEAALPGDGLGRLGGGRMLRWLRENGRHLSPNGAGDLLLGGAVMFRNWAALQVVCLTFLLAVFLLLQLLRAVVQTGIVTGNTWLFNVEIPLHALPGGQDVFWWSPYTLLFVVSLLGAAVPAWSYWMVWQAMPDQDGKSRSGIDPRLGLYAAVALGLLFALLPGLPDWSRLLAAIVAATGCAAYGHWWHVTTCAPRKVSLPPGNNIPFVQKQQFFNANARHTISRHLKNTLLVCGALAGIAVIDTFGQTLYLIARDPNTTIDSWMAGTFTGLTALALAGRRIAVYFSRKPGAVPGLPQRLVASVIAFLILALVLITVDALSHGFAWKFARPIGYPPALVSPPTPNLANADVAIVRNDTEPWVIAAQARPMLKLPPLAHRDDWRDLTVPAIATLIALLFAALFARTWPFLNRSSQHPLYASRLTRAYLGASNPWRIGPVPRTYTDTLYGDDIDAELYWRGFTESGPDDGGVPVSTYHKGAPIHLVNVTLNETVSGQSQIQQRDRKGCGMALGPAGINAGVRHHVVYRRAPGTATGPADRNVSVYPPCADPDQPCFQVFAYPRVDASPGDGRRYTGENLSLGEWIAISGAAFSTALGSRTSLGLSLLAGLVDLRTGYWWDSHIAPARHDKPAGGAHQSTQATILSRMSLPGRLFTRLFPAYSYLIDEFIARFHGPMRRSWYLSDGGHFENLGGYELLRRRLPIIVVVDAECDPDYTFDGLANLVRKARLDFQAEVRFLEPAELDEYLEPAARRWFGPLGELRRGRWSPQPGSPPAAPGSPAAALCAMVFEGVDEQLFSRRVAALAQVTYADGVTSWLVYIKPTLLGDEPVDLLKYHADNPSFPQQTTADQFFDEAQWESYRKVGELVAGRIFATGDRLDGFLRAPT